MKRIVLLFISLLLFFYSYAIRPDRKYLRLPQNLGLIYKELTVGTKDGYRIETWFYPAQDLPEKDAGQTEKIPYKTIDKETRPTIIFCGGDAGNMSYSQMDFAMLYASCGFNVVTFDWRGFGVSSDFEMNSDYLCYTEMLADYEAVIKAVSKQPEVDKKRIYLMGWSTGAYLSIIAAQNSKNVKGCIAQGTPSSFEDLVPHLIKINTKCKTEENLIVPDDFPRHQMPSLIAPKYKKSILLIVGNKDAVTPVWMSEKIYNTLPETINKKLSVYENAGHMGSEHPYFVDYKRWIDETTAFMLD